MTSTDYHITLNIGDKAHSANGYGWKTSIRRLYPLPPLADNSLPQTYTPAALNRHRFDTASQAAKCANDYLDRAAAQVVADWSSNEAVVISPGNFETIELKGCQWSALAAMAGDASRDDWHKLPEETHTEMVKLAAHYLQQNATDITGLVAENVKAALREAAAEAGEETLLDLPEGRRQ